MTKYIFFCCSSEGRGSRLTTLRLVNCVYHLWNGTCRGLLWYSKLCKSNSLYEHRLNIFKLFGHTQYIFIFLSVLVKKRWASLFSRQFDQLFMIFLLGLFRCIKLFCSRFFVLFYQISMLLLSLAEKNMNSIKHPRIYCVVWELKSRAIFYVLKLFPNFEQLTEHFSLQHPKGK